MNKLLYFICFSCFFKAEAQQPSALSTADSLYSVGNYTRAIASYEEIKPLTEAIFLKIARAQKARGTLDEALSNYKKAASGSEQAIALNEFGKLLYTTAHYKEADSIFSLLINTYTKNPNFYYQRGRVRKELLPGVLKPTKDSLKSAKNDENRSFIADFEKAVALDSTHQKALYETALFYLMKKKFDTVEQLCQKALKTYPENVKMISLLAQEKFSTGFVTPASQGFEKLLVLGQKSQFIHEKLAMCYYKKHMHEKAITQYLQALAQDTQNYEIHENLSKLYNIIKDFEKAESHAEIALSLKDLPLDGNYYTLGTTYKEIKKWKSALDCFNKCLAENPEHRKARYYKAVVADNYYKDDRAVLTLYEDFITRYENTDYAEYDPYLKRAKERRGMLREEIFMSKKKEE